VLTVDGAKDHHKAVQLRYGELHDLLGKAHVERVILPVISNGRDRRLVNVWKSEEAIQRPRVEPTLSGHYPGVDFFGLVLVPDVIIIHDPEPLEPYLEVHGRRVHEFDGIGLAIG
jgi:hypothetical protein